MAFANNTCFLTPTKEEWDRIEQLCFTKGIRWIASRPTYIAGARNYIVVRNGHMLCGDCTTPVETLGYTLYKHKEFKDE